MYPNLAAYNDKRHIKVFQKALQVIDKQLDSVHAAERAVVIESYNEHKGVVQRFFEGINTDEIDQIMAIETSVGKYPVSIEMHMINTGWWLPLILYVTLPAPIPGPFQCDRGMFGRKWIGAPGTSSFSKQIDKILPKILMNHHWVAMLVKMKTCFSFQPLEDDTTLWTTYIGFKPGMRNHPKVKLSPVIRCAKPLENVLLASKVKEM